MSRNPLKAFMDIRREELPLALLMFTYFFLVITSFWILKPIKKSLFIEHYDATGFTLGTWVMTAAQAELLAKVLNMVVAAVAVTVFTWLARKLARQQLTIVFSLFFVVSYLGYMATIARPGDATVWTFYLFGDLFSTLMVATFFAFLNDSVTPEKAKRLYGLVGLGGVAGGVFGTTVLRTFIDHVDNVGWLAICAGIAVAIIVVAWAAGRIVDRQQTAEPGPVAASTEEEPPPVPAGNPAIEGAKLVFRSPYLLSIVGIVGLYEIVSTVMDYQFSATIAHYLDGPAIGRQFSTQFAITNVVSLLVQMFVTSFVMTRFGIGIALLILPIAALGGSAAFMALPILWVGSFLNTADNGFSYSVNQSAKEALYVPTSRDEKYKAKAFIDMFVQRLAKAIAVGVSLAMAAFFAEFESLRWLSLFTIAIVVLWIFAARYAGRKFDELSDRRQPSR